MIPLDVGGREMAKAELYSTSEYNERITHTCAEDAIKELLDDCDPGDWPDEIIVYGFDRMEPDPRVFSESLLEQILERLDEDFGDPDNETEITTEMRDAESTFIRAVLDEYTPFACGQVSEESVNLLAWVIAEQPLLCRQVRWTESGGHLTALQRLACQGVVQFVRWAAGVGP